MGRAEDLYKQVVEHGLTVIDGFIEASTTEELFLDFKRSCTNGDGRKLPDAERNNFAKAISGFGNSEGGVLVWGVDCSKSSAGADVARFKTPIQDALRFAGWLQGTISGCTIPPHQGVQVFPIVAGPGKDGFVVCLIPKSNHAPHQVVGRLQYYIRAGSDFVPTPHAVLAGMFGRNPQPNVFVNYLVGHPSIEERVVKASCGFMLYNSGPGIASDLFANVLVISSPGPNCKVSFATTDSKNWGGWSFGHRISLISNPGYRVPPDTHVQPLVIDLEIVPPINAPSHIKCIVGAGTSVPCRFELEQGPQRIRATYDALVYGHASGTLTKSERHAFVPRILGVDEDKLNTDNF